MVARSLVLRQLRHHRLPLRLPSRRITTNATQKNVPKAQPPAQEKSWLTRKVESSPAAMKFFVGLTNILGYGSPKQLAGRRGLALYEHVCAVKPDADSAFWQQGCHLPPTFQSWFTVTNLHIWMLTVRLRALPDGKYYSQALIDHFFLDVEDRIRAVLQPPAKPANPYTFVSPFYINPNAPSSSNPKTALRTRAPDRLVTRQMKIFKEQWAGMGLAFDLGLVKGDMEMAGAVWRNLLGARGAQGIAFPEPPSSPSSSSSPADPTSPASPPARRFRRSVNLVGGEVVNVAKIDLEAEEAKDDGSGVHDFAPEEADLYLEYPQLMLDVVGYVRRELVRLEKLSDEEIMHGSLERIKFGPVRG
ncbi:putative ubiquinol-cytochrome C chaperone [Lyophyllum shimeji]|uniref:Ubiquinol-cytochrome C chaperone n=1 Tax=Lyophyllum shimeji TaxID=47721 RepID=A0A9P3ULJ1_LYOSH|nr:putative ubiquinol-cytochrome C chaperone [Lyophyllum shimeji]